MEMPSGYMDKINVTINLGPASKSIVNAAPKAAPGAGSATCGNGIRFKMIESVTEYYELSPELDAETRQKRASGNLLFAVR